MADTSPANALNIVRRIEQACEFMGLSDLDTLVANVPVTMLHPDPQLQPGARGFDVRLWVGLGTVGLWACLDAYAERAKRKQKCATCGRECIHRAYEPHSSADEATDLAELEDLRHLYAHNYAGKADEVYFKKKRHVLKSGASHAFRTGGRFDGHSVQLDFRHLRAYAESVRGVLERFH